MSKNTQLSKTDRSAAKIVAESFTRGTLDSMITDAVKSGDPAGGVESLLNELTKVVLDRALQTEMTHHIGYESGDPEGRGSGNCGNGSSRRR